MAIDNERELFELKKLVSENNQILRNLQRKSRWGTFFTTVRWTIIIVLTLGIYTYVQPVVSKFIDSYGVIVDSANKIKEIKEQVPGFNLKDILSR